MGLCASCFARRRDEDPEPTHAFLDKKLLKEPEPLGGTDVSVSAPSSVRKIDTEALKTICENMALPAETLNNVQAVPLGEHAETEAAPARVTSSSRVTFSMPPTAKLPPTAMPPTAVQPEMHEDPIEASDVMPSPSAHPRKVQYRSLTNWFSEVEVGRASTPIEPERSVGLANWYSSDSVSIPQESNGHHEDDEEDSEAVPPPPIHFYNLASIRSDDCSKRTLTKDNSFTLTKDNTPMRTHPAPLVC